MENTAEPIPPLPPSFTKTPDEKRDAPKTEPRIRTMKSDIEELFRRQKGTAIPAITKEVTAPPLREHLHTTELSSKKRMSPTTLLIAGCGAIALVAGGAYYYISTNAPKPTGTSLPQKREVSVPRSFFSMEKSRNIVIRPPDFLDYSQALSIIENDAEQAGTLKRIVLIVAADGVDERLADFKEFLSAAKITLPAGMEDGIDDEFNFFLTYHASGVGRGLIVPITNETRTFRAMVEGEVDFHERWKSLYHTTDATPGSVVSFEDITYRNIDIRGLTFGTGEGVGFYYTIFKPKKYLIVTTSFEGVKAVLDRVFDAL